MTGIAPRALRRTLGPGAHRRTCRWPRRGSRPADPNTALVAPRHLARGESAPLGGRSDRQASAARPARRRRADRFTPSFEPRAEPKGESRKVRPTFGTYENLRPRITTVCTSLFRRARTDASKPPPAELARPRPSAGGEPGVALWGSTSACRPEARRHTTIPMVIG